MRVLLKGADARHEGAESERTASTKLWLGLAALVAGFAHLASGCGGDGGGQGGNAITVNWGTEAPSLDPGLASDVTSANIL